MNELTDLAMLVLEVLRAQRIYFNTRDREDLVVCKALEHELEVLARRALAGAQQPGLFDGDASKKPKKHLCIHCGGDKLQRKRASMGPHRFVYFCPACCRLNDEWYATCDHCQKSKAPTTPATSEQPTLLMEEPS